MKAPTIAALNPQVLTSLLSGCSWIDLTHTISETMPIFPGGEPYHMENLSTIEQKCFANRFSTSEHNGTHVDAPAHFKKGGRHIDQLGIADLVGPLAVIDVRDEVAKVGEFEVGVADILRWEAKHGELPPGCFVIANTGWDARWNEPERYINARPDGVLEFPGFSSDVAEFLVQSRDIKGVGIDTLSTDKGSSQDFAQHHIMLKAGKINIEGLTNLDKLPPAGTYLIVAPLRLEGGSGAPARVFALIPSTLASTKRE